MFSLEGKNALVCGASQGIGAAIAQTFAAQGARVALLARNRENLERIADGLPRAPQHKVISCDVMNRDKLLADIRGLMINWKTVHILVNNTSGPKAGPITEAADEDFRWAMDAHVVTASILCRELLPAMKSVHFGRIINIISTSVKVPIANLGVSNTIRAAVANWAKTLSMDVAADGITVNNILPGFTKTERLDELANVTAKRRNVSVDQVTKDWIAAIPARRLAEPAEIAAVAAFLASPEAAYVNGVSLAVDGGRTGCH